MASPTTNSISPVPTEEEAVAIAAAIEKPRPEIYPHALSRALPLLNALAPGFLRLPITAFLAASLNALKVAMRP